VRDDHREVRAPSHMKREISTVVFDFGDVLNWHMKLEEEKQKLVECSGLERDVFFARYWEFRSAYDRGTLDTFEYWTHVLAPHSAAPDSERIRQLVHADINASLRLNPVMWTWVRRLKSAGYTLAVLSNLPFDLMSYHRENSFSGLFDRLFFSCELNRLKPEEEIYLHVERELGVAGTELLFLDDKPENVAAAQRRGWHGVVFESSDQLSQVINRNFPIPSVSTEEAR
jgi:putative hydrolase of the HAD superfamily